MISRYGHTITKISEDEVIIYGGFDSSDNAISNCDLIKIDTFVITNIYKENEERPSSRGFHNILPIGPILVLYGGKSGNRENLNDFWKFIISTKKWVKLTKINEFYLFRSGYIFTKLIGTERPVIYGGENRNRETITDLILFNFPICSSETNIFNNNMCLPCAEGHVLSNQQKCEKCSIGTFSHYKEKYIESKCNYCPKATYNDKIGSFGLHNCNICKFKTFNDEIGKSTCTECKHNELCTPSIILLKKRQAH